MNEDRVAELLDALTPSYDGRQGDWSRVVASARSRRRWTLRLAAVAVTAAAVGAVVLAWPVHDEPALLERARAAIGDGPVIHVVLRGEWGGTLVDLRSGARSPVYGENEIWYDSERGRVHLVSRLGGVVQDEGLYEPRKAPADLAALGSEYKEALDDGSARVTGEDTIDGEPVVWVTIHSELLPDVADGKDHEWAQQVAVSRRTFKPVALRETRDRRPGPGTLQRVIDLEFLPAGAGDFGAVKANSLDGVPFRQGRELIRLDEARPTLGRTPLWLGREYRGAPISEVFKETISRGKRVGESLVWVDERTSVGLVYGDVMISESVDASALSHGLRSYVPPAGSVFLAAGGTGFLQLNGVHVSIAADGEDAILAAARELRPMPANAPR